jgi:hypothetical protein
VISQAEAFRIISGESIDEVRITKRTARIRIGSPNRGDTRTGSVRRKRGETVAEMLVRAVESAFAAPTDIQRWRDAEKRYRLEAPKRARRKIMQRAMSAPVSGLPC